MKQKPKVNPLRPTMREKKRYVAYEIKSSSPLGPQADKVVVECIARMLGTVDSAKAGIMRLRYDSKTQTGILRVDRQYVDHIRAAFVTTRSIESQPVMLRTLNVSGMLTKAAAHIGGR